jgi:hypothetical protein
LTDLTFLTLPCPKLSFPLSSLTTLSATLDGLPRNRGDEGNSRVSMGNWKRLVKAMPSPGSGYPYHCTKSTYVPSWQIQHCGVRTPRKHRCPNNCLGTQKRSASRKTQLEATFGLITKGPLYGTKEHPTSHHGLLGASCDLVVNVAVQETIVGWMIGDWQLGTLWSESTDGQEQLDSNQSLFSAVRGCSR